MSDKLGHSRLYKMHSYVVCGYTTLRPVVNFSREEIARFFFYLFVFPGIPGTNTQMHTIINNNKIKYAYALKRLLLLPERRQDLNQKNIGLFWFASVFFFSAILVGWLCRKYHSHQRLHLEVLNQTLFDASIPSGASNSRNQSQKM